MALIHIPNEVSQQVILAAGDSGAVSAPTPTVRLLGEYSTQKNQQLATTQEVTGTFVRRATPSKQPATLSGTYSERLTFESFPWIQRFWVAPGATGVGVVGATGAYEYSKSPNLSQDDVERFAVEHNVEGLGFQDRGVRFNEGTVTIDVDDADGAWKFSGPLMMVSQEALGGALEGTATSGTTTTLVMTGAGWSTNEWQGAWVFIDWGTGVEDVRQVASNDATTLTWTDALGGAVTNGTDFRIEGLFTAGVAVPDYEVIPSYGTKVYLDPAGGTIGTTEIDNDRIISVNFTYGLNLDNKRFLNNLPGQLSQRMGRGEALATFQIRYEFDRRTEYQAWEQMDEFQVRIEQTGTQLDDSPLTNKLARIDLSRCFWDQPTRDTRNNNLTVTMAGVCYLDTPYFTMETINALSTLPA